MKRSPHYGYWILATSVALLLLGAALAPHDSQAARPLSPEQTVQRAWRLAQESGAYHFATEIVQTTYPAPALVNVGRSSRQDTLHIEGQTNLPARTLQMTLWKDGGSLLNPSDGVEMRIVGDQAYGRSVGSEWQEIDDFSGAFAPDNDLLAYLAGAKNVRAIAESPVTDHALRITRYAYDVDGPALAAYLRDQLETYLREKGELPANLTLGVSDQFREATGAGEVWIDQHGLPLRLTAHLIYPEQQNGELVEADIQTDFSTFALVYQAQSRLARVAGALGLPRTPADRLRAIQHTLLTLSLLGWLVLLVRYSRSRVFYTALALVIVCSLVILPLLESQQVHAFSQHVAAQRMEQEQRQEEQDAARELQEELTASNWNPNRDPLAAGPVEDAILSTQSAGWSMTDNEWRVANVEPTPAPDSDEDGDGLTYSIESRLGTDDDNADTDGDQIPDPIEVAGFEWPGGSGKRWYSDPTNPDSNGDGLTDMQECWATFPPRHRAPVSVSCRPEPKASGRE